ncbi:MAG: rhomboid family intramembrane serine protease [Thermodesulfobacteriota bacterium]
MLPLRDDIPSRRFPAVNLLLIVVTTLVFFYELSLGEALVPFLRHYGFVPARFVAQGQTGPLDPERFLPVFASIFLHGGFLHLIGNMWMLWIFGDNVEDILGHGRYLLFYLLCGVAAVAFQGMVHPGATVPMVGASGAISGVLGAYLLSFPRARILTLVPLFIFFYMIEVPAFIYLILWFVMQFLQGSANLAGGMEGGGVAWWAHVGGFIAGMILLPVLGGRPRPRSRGRLTW